MYLILGSGTVQPWALDNTTDDGTVNRPEEKSSADGKALQDSLVYDDDDEKKKVPIKGASLYGSISVDTKPF